MEWLIRFLISLKSTFFPRQELVVDSERYDIQSLTDMRIWYHESKFNNQFYGLERG